MSERKLIIEVGIDDGAGGSIEDLEREILVQDKTGRNVMVMVEEMNAKQARLFSLLDLGKFMVS